MLLAAAASLGVTLDWDEPDQATSLPGRSDDASSLSERTLHRASSGLLERLQQGGGPMTQMHAGSRGGDPPELSVDEQDMLSAMAGQFRVRSGSSASKGLAASFGEHAGVAPRPPHAVAGSSDAIQLLADGGAVTASPRAGKVTLSATASGAHDGGLELLATWCPDWAPVCTADGHTLPSRCWARSVGLDVAHPGACLPSRRASLAASMVEAPASLQPTPAPQHDTPKPPAVAGVLDEVVSMADSAASPTDETVDPVCGCPLTDAAPVCGTNGKTYDSYCWARCDKTEVARLGPCKKPF